MKHTGTLTIIATPIGNLSDVSYRAVEVLKCADFILCEDTRRSRILIKHYGIDRPLESYHDHTRAAKRQKIIERIQKGFHAALISDAGTPLISDPGFNLVREALERDIEVEQVPGPTAFLQALIVSGLAVHHFSFFGYPPAKSGKRETLFVSLRDDPKTLIFYESPYRVLATLKALKKILGNRRVSVSRELTKKFEETRRSTLDEMIPHFEAVRPVGEFVIVVAGQLDKTSDSS